MVDFLNKYNPLRVLAEGSYGKVILAQRLHKHAGELVAIKIFHFREDESSSQSRKNSTKSKPDSSKT